MARDFDGTNDRIDCGSDASLDSFSSKTMAYWYVRDVGLAVHSIIQKDRFAIGWGAGHGSTANNKVYFMRDFDTTNGEWTSTNVVGAGAISHVVITYVDGISNDPVIYLNNVSETVLEVSTPTLTVVDDAANSLTLGETGGGANDFNGRLGFVCYDNTIWTAADVNRHYWWGCAPGGPSTVKVWQPFWTSELTNKGTAVANGTATGTTMASLPRVERMWGSMMGCGR